MKIILNRYVRKYKSLIFICFNKCNWKGFDRIVVQIHMLIYMNEWKIKLSKIVIKFIQSLKLLFKVISFLILVWCIQCNYFYIKWQNKTYMSIHWICITSAYKFSLRRCLHSFFITKMYHVRIHCSNPITPTLWTCD